jgi:hypothetical protein
VHLILPHARRDTCDENIGSLRYHMVFSTTIYRVTTYTCNSITWSTSGHLELLYASIRPPAGIVWGHFRTRTNMEGVTSETAQS